MIAVKETNIFPPKYHVLAQEYHLHHGDEKIKAVRVYRVYRDPRETVCTEWLLTRFRSAAGTVASALHMICPGGRGGEYLSEYFSCERKNEKLMIDKWMAFVEEEDDG